MEFDSKLGVLQSVLRNQEKIHGSLLSINEGNETKVNKIVTKLLKTVEEECLSKDDLRRVYLLVLLNTDQDCLGDSFQDPNYVHILDSIPKLSNHLFIAIVNRLKLEEFLYESILFLPPPLSINVIEIYFTLLKTREPFQLLKYVDFICRAVYIKLVLLDQSKGDENIFRIKLKYFECLQSALGYFSSSESDDYKSWEQNKLYYFCACIMKAATSIVKTCCQYFVQPIIIKEACHDIYNLDMENDFKKTIKIQIDVTEDDLLKHCIQLILSKFLTSAQSVTVFTWMAWLELDDYTDENLQANIGNEIYYCLEYIKEEKVKNCLNSHLHSDLIAVLTNLSIKPTNEDDEIKSADFRTIVSSINDSSKTQAKWLSALISHKDFTPDIFVLNSIFEKVDLLNQKDCEIFFDKYIKFLENSSSSFEEEENNLKVKNLFKQIVITSLKNFHVDNQIVLIESFIKKSGITDMLKLPEFDTQLTEIFNKVIEKDDQTLDFYSDLIGITLQSPETVLRKISSDALTSNKHGRLMVNLLKVLKPICVFKSKEDDKSVLFQILNDMMAKTETFSDSEKENFVTLVTRLINKSLIEGSEYLANCLMPLLYESVKNNKWQHIILLLNILKCFTDGSMGSEEIELKFPVHLVFLGQLMDKTRCTLSNYNGQSAAVCDKSLEVLTSVLELFDVDEQEIGAMNWLKREMQKLNIITQVHILSYINVPSLSEHISKNSIEVYWLKLILCGMDTDLSFLHDMRRDFFLRTFTKLLPGFTLREWKIMFTNLVPKEEVESLHALFIAAADAVLFIIATVVPHITNINEDGPCGVTANGDDVAEKTSQVISSSAASCLSFIIKNLITVVQDILFPHAKKMTRDELADIFIKICYILHDFPQAANNYTSWTLLKVLQDLITFAQLSLVRRKDNPNIIEINKFCAGIGLLPNYELRQNLSKTILASTKCSDETIV